MEQSIAFEPPVDEGREPADPGVSAVAAFVRARPRDRHRAAVRLHGLLAGLHRAQIQAVLDARDVTDRVLGDLLSDANALVRAVTVRLIGCLGDSRRAPLLTGLVAGDADPFVRTRAVEALGHLGAADAIPLLLATARDLTQPGRYAAVRALGCLLPASAPALMAIALNHDEAAIRRAAAEAIAADADAGVWAEFVDTIPRTRADDVRAAVVEGFGRSRATRAAIPIVRVLVQDPSVEVRTAATYALVALRDPRTLGALYEAALYDPFERPRSTGGNGRERGGVSSAPGDFPVREAAAEAVLALGGVDAWEELAAPVDDLVALPAAPQPAGA